MEVLICDDSKVARKSIELALPKSWDIEVRFAESGQKVLDLVEQSKTSGKQPKVLSV
ncbi:MAG: hypothetical protein ACQEVQ_06120 [Pseudomonadota bacterium]